MTYKQAREYISSLLKFGIKPGLETTAGLLSRLGNPQDKLKYVHIAGTSGKGSTAAMIYEALRAAGQSAGMYTSPYVLDFRERIQINGHMISKPALCGAAAAVMAAAARPPRLDITEFEAITAAAFLCFAEAGCDIVVLETGLGGRLDATNVIKQPECALITSLGLDHIDILGGDIESIAYEKCGIIKGGVCVSYPQPYTSAARKIAAIAAGRSARLVLPDMGALKDVCCELGESEFVYKDRRYRTAMMGEHQVYNALCAIEVCGVLGLEAGAAARGIAAAALTARAEILKKEPPFVMLDGAHNADKIGALCDAVRPFLPVGKAIFVLGMLADKDIGGALGSIAPLAQHIITVKVNSPRTLSAAALRREALKVTDEVTAAESYSGALRLARDIQARSGLPVIITGSLYLAASMRRKAMDIFK